MKPYAYNNFEGIIKNFVITIEEFQSIKEPKIRNLRMQSKLQNLMKLNGGMEGTDNIENNFFNPDAFFENIFNSYN